MIHFKPSRHRRCSSEVWSRRLAQCLTFSNGTQSNRNDFYRRSNFTIVSIMHLTSQRVWPLHLLTIRNPYTRKGRLEADSMTFTVLTACVLSAGGFMSAFGFLIGYQKWKQSSENHEISQYVIYGIYIHFRHKIIKILLFCSSAVLNATGMTTDFPSLQQQCNSIENEYDYISVYFPIE